MISLVYVFVIAKLGPQFLPGFLILLISRLRSVPPSVRSTLFLLILAVRSNPLSPGLALAMVVLTLRGTFETSIGASWRRFGVLLLVVILFAPLPRLRLSDTLTKFLETNLKFELFNVDTDPDPRSERVFQLNRPMATTKSADSGLNNSSSPLLNQNFRRFLYELSVAMSVLLTTVLFVWLVLWLRRAGVSQREILRRTLTVLLLSTGTMALLLYVVFPSVASNLKLFIDERIHRHSVEVPVESSKQASEGYPPNDTDSTTATADGGESDRLGELLTLFQITGLVLALLSTVAMIRSIIDLLKIERTAQGTGERRGDEEPVLVFDTSLDFDDVMRLPGSQFVEHAYMFLRKTFFPTLDHLTPYELMKGVEGQVQGRPLTVLSSLTEEFVRLRYAMMRPSNFDEWALKRDFADLCRELRTIPETQILKRMSSE